MRNEIKTISPDTKLKRGWRYLALASLGSFTSASYAIDNLEVILDGYAYTAYSNVIISLNPQFIFIADSDLVNCLRPGGLIPLNNADSTLITNNQGIGINKIRYAVESRLLFLTSETSNVVCENGLFVDQIFVQGFEN